MSNSSLVSYTQLSPNNSGHRTHVIDRITPHCVVGQLTAKSICNCFASRKVEASCNYGIGSDGEIALIVDEGNRSWCSSSRENDQRSVTIECASDTTSPYAFKTIVYDKLVELCTDICRRNGKNKLIWFGDKNKSLNYNPAGNEMVLTVHRWFANKACPGDWMYQRMGNLANEVSNRLDPVKPAKPVDNVEKGVCNKMETFYKTYNDVPEYYQPTIKKLMDCGVLRGKRGGTDPVIDVSETFCRIFTILNRMGKI